MNTEEATNSGASTQGANDTGAAETPQSQSGRVDNSRLDKLEADFQALQSIAENQKKEISSRDRTITELSKKVKEYELAGKSEEERIQAELESIRQEADRFKSEAENLRRSQLVAKELSKAGLNIDKFQSFITGSDEKTISEQVSLLSEQIGAIATEKKQAEINSIMAGGKPKAGTESSQGDLQTMYNNAKSKNDIPLMNAIKRKARDTGVLIH